MSLEKDFPIDRVDLARAVIVLQGALAVSAPPELCAKAADLLTKHPIVVAVVTYPLSGERVIVDVKVP